MVTKLIHPNYMNLHMKLHMNVHVESMALLFVSTHVPDLWLQFKDGLGGGDTDVDLCREEGSFGA
ncbi:hypothetical protein PSQ19_05340 [Devosia algicola]|uniref:Uncharacterized protein n=1 Tax=Devosia algicola TaxID=3026418 RepID=A0ABY7YQQ3_9HYPH|nr:hypothetical protein [Devosia algicola]WDR03517.1 hypothetical protein PSQ19_05340 [Devosia algicola]